MQVVDIWNEMPSASNIQYPEPEDLDRKASSLEMWMQWEAHRLKLLADCEEMARELPSRVPSCTATVVINEYGIPSVAVQCPRPVEHVRIKAEVIPFIIPKETP